MSSVQQITAIDAKSCKIECDKEVIRQRYLSYLSDESKLEAQTVKGIAFPESEAELVWLVNEARESKSKLFTVGSQTGTVAGAVPDEDAILVSLSKFKSIGQLEFRDSKAFIKVSPGLTLFELNQYLLEEHPSYFFPVDPTETSASIGGMVSTNASGARSYRYGSAKDWISKLRVVLSDGSLLELEKGQQQISSGAVQLSSLGSLSAVEIPKPNTKHTLGYNYYEGMSLYELFVGAEGTLGIISEIELELEKVPEMRLYYMQFFKSEESLFDYVDLLKEQNGLSLFAIEFFDEKALQLVAESSVAKDNKCARMIQPDFVGGIYLEIELANEEHFVEVYENLESYASKVSTSIEDSIGGFEDTDLREMKAFRHAVPESINAIIAKRKNEHPKLHKIATDMAVPDKDSRQMYSFYKSKLDDKGFEYSAFGHIGNNHLHVNILPRDEGELTLAKELYAEFAKEVVSLDGAVSAEHGIGRIKKRFLKIQYSEQVISEMKKIKKFFDPQLMFNPGVLFD